jgi:hypothetical protein
MTASATSDSIPVNRRRATLASTVGTSVDWYDLLLTLGRDEAGRQQAGRSTP